MNETTYVHRALPIVWIQPTFLTCYWIVAIAKEDEEKEQEEEQQQQDKKQYHKVAATTTMITTAIKTTVSPTKWN